ncbi:MAG: DUF421 domain-containing protein [bacterium]|nr:DUF421 domain-containing protein [bacterium]
MEYFIIIFRTFFFYFFIVFVYRVMGKREVGQLGIIDLIVSVLIAELVAISLDNTDDSIFITIIPIILLVLCQIGMALLSLNKKGVREMFDGKPSVIINNGKIMIKEMIKQRYNLDDLLTQLREQNFKSVSEVDYAILETSGKLSVFKKEKTSKKTFPLPVIIEGKPEYDTLKLLNKDVSWLLDNLNTDISEVFYGFYKDNSIYIIKNSDL